MEGQNQNQPIDGEFYHLYGRSFAKNGKLFYQARNYDSFLKYFNQYFADYLDVWAYCLIPNHFHFLVRVKLKVDTTIAEQWKAFSEHYSLLINKQENRCGNLFQPEPSFLKIKNNSDLIAMLKYINYNPVYHGLVDKPADWRYSSHTRSKNNRLINIEINQLTAIFERRNAFSNFQCKAEDFEPIQYCLAE